MQFDSLHYCGPADLPKVHQTDCHALQLGGISGDTRDCVAVVQIRVLEQHFYLEWRKCQLGRPLERIRAQLPVHRGAYAEWVGDPPYDHAYLEEQRMLGHFSDEEEHHHCLRLGLLHLTRMRHFWIFCLLLRQNSRQCNRRTASKHTYACRH